MGTIRLDEARYYTLWDIKLAVPSKRLDILVIEPHHICMYLYLIQLTVEKD